MSESRAEPVGTPPRSRPAPHTAPPPPPSTAGVAEGARAKRPQGQPRTLWEEGRRPGRQVTALAVLVALLAAGLNLAFTGRLTLFFDLVFVVLCLVAAFAVRPRDFFRVGVLPPLLMLATVLTLALVSPGFVADPDDSLVQAVVSGLAHHAGGLVAGYAPALAVLALRQLAVRNSGRIRSGS